jgi:hypothetical protein
MTRAALLLVLLLPASVLAQGLGDAAAKERQKRARQPTPAKVFTDADLPSRETPAGPGLEGSADPSSPDSDAAPRDSIPADPKAPKDPLEKERQARKLLEAEWRVRFANAREQLALAEAASWREVVRTEFYQGIPVQMKIKEQIETAELKQAREALALLQEEFRRTGLPPGWARDD